MSHNNKNTTEADCDINMVPAGTPGDGLLRRFRKNRRGTVAIEFALIALPLFLLIFAIIEVGLSFMAQ